MTKRFDKFDVSVIVCTYNRCDILPDALESILAQETGGVQYEVVVVDNNSTDKTRQVIESFIERGQGNIRYVFEGKQGLSHARNAGIMTACAPIVALTDDDLRVAPDWVAQIKRAFDEHPDVSIVGSRVVPQWKTEPPAWLTTANWSPLALYDKPNSYYTNADNAQCLIGISLRRDVFEKIGYFSPELLKIGASSSEDHELQMRLWRAGYKGLYEPKITVFADVQAERMSKAYHRLWHTGHGKSMAIMGLHEAIDENGRLVEKIPNVITLFGVPAFIYRELFKVTGQWATALARRQADESFRHENQLRYYANYIRKRFQQNAGMREHSPLKEIGSFIKTLARKKLSLPDNKDIVTRKD
jgi:glycosyltransferase involved in cell wall biosynthesis